MRLLAMAMALGVTIHGALAQAPEPFEVIERASKVFNETSDTSRARAVFSEAIRQAKAVGPLHQDWAIVFAMYSDSSRFDGNPSFALQLAEEGLALVDRQIAPDERYRNALAISRAYALADLGRFGEAAEQARSLLDWMGADFGDDARAGLETEINSWSAKALASNAGAADISVLSLSEKLLADARTALFANDTATALALAGRAALPSSTAVDAVRADFVNASALLITGTAFDFEGRKREAHGALLRAARTLFGSDWSPGMPLPERVELQVDGEWRVLAADVLTRLGSVAAGQNLEEEAAAALDAARGFIDTPGRRHALLVQQAGLHFRSKDYDRTIAVFAESEREAREAGDTFNASLSAYYARVVTVYRAGVMPTREDLGALTAAARDVARLAEGDLQMQNYVLSNTVMAMANTTTAPDMTLAMARDAFDVFLRRQRSFGGYEAGEEAARRDNRRFLEDYVGTLYDVSASAEPTSMPEPKAPTAQ